MPHIGPVLEGRTFFCPHCGALYSETPSLVPKSGGDAEDVSSAIRSWTSRKQPKTSSSSTDLTMTEKSAAWPARKCFPASDRRPRCKKQAWSAHQKSNVIDA